MIVKNEWGVIPAMLLPVPFGVRIYQDQSLGNKDLAMLIIISKQLLGQQVN